MRLGGSASPDLPQATGGLFPVPQLLLHRLPQLLVRHVQISLRGFQICMTEQELKTMTALRRTIKFPGK